MIVYAPSLSGSEMLSAMHFGDLGTRRAPSGFELSKRALLQRQRAAQKAIEEALAKTYGARDAREIAFHLSQCFEGAEFLVALQLDAGRFSKAEIEASVSDVLEALDYIWEAARVAGYPLPCLEDETLHDDDEDI